MTVSEPSDYRIAASSCYTKIRYSVRVVGGPVLKGAQEPELMDFVTGYGHVIPGLEKRLVGHGTGERLSFTVPAEEAFGPRHQELVIEKPKSDFHFPPGMAPYQGMQLPLITSASDAPDTVIIREVRDNSIVIDCNHPLAGAALQYELEIVEARPAKSTDVCGEWEQQGAEHQCCGQVPEIVLGEEKESEN
ncbi:MAG: FKBP-type peptidyl-prolyl cis-trans isomerase [Desulfomonile tiedjei]|nr:FKBP-type peptidyl-prolyl cis-trans isomerase [Desulfomonile tiedjei]